MVDPHGTRGSGGGEDHGDPIVSGRCYGLARPFCHESRPGQEGPVQITHEHAHFSLCSQQSVENTPDVAEVLGH